MQLAPNIQMQTAATRRNWLAGNLGQISSAYPQLKINCLTPAGIIIATTNPTEQIKLAASQITDAPCHIMKVQFLKCEDRHAMLVNPI